MERPLVSIIINNYNYGRFVRDAIDSALAQAYTPIEVVVVDDGSTDDSRDIIASYGDRVVAVLKENGGQGSAFNAGFAASHGRIICMLDSDDTFMPGKVATIVDVFQRYPEAAWCFHALKRMDIQTGSALPSVPGGATREIDFRSDLKAARMPTFARATSATCFSRALLQQLLPMPELEGTSADRYLKMAALALSKGVYVDRELAYQKIHGENAYTLRPEKQRVGAKSLIFTSCWIRSRFPTFARFSNKLFGMGLGIYWRTGGVEDKYRYIVQEYLDSISFLERCGIKLRAFYHSQPWLGKVRSALTRQPPHRQAHERAVGWWV